MIVNHLPQLMALKEISIRQLSRDTGITYSTLWAMVHSQRRSVQFEVLDAVCARLAAQPGDIYQRVTGDLTGELTNLEDPPSAHHEQPSGQATAATTERTSWPVSDEAGDEWRSW